MKQKLIDYLLNNSAYLDPKTDKELVTEIIEKLDTIKAINPLWTLSGGNYVPPEQVKLPTELFLTTPMFRGMVNLKHEGSNYYYICGEQIVLSARSENDMIKKLTRYGTKF